MGGGHRPRRRRRRGRSPRAPSRSSTLVDDAGPAAGRADVTPRCTADEAAALLRPVDTLGMPLGPGPAAGVPRGARAGAPTGRTCASAARCSPCSPTCSPTRTSTTSAGSSARSSGCCATAAPTSASPRPTSAASRRSSRPHPPRVMATAAAPPDADGWCSLSLHAGATVGQLHAAGADPDRLLVVEVGDRVPPHARRSSRPPPRRRTSTRSTC